MRTPGGIGMLVLGPSNSIGSASYGDIEIEGVLLSGCDTARYDCSGPVNEWIPLDLSEFRKGQQLSERPAAFGQIGIEESSPVQNFSLNRLGVTL